LRVVFFGPSSLASAFHFSSRGVSFFSGSI
jgi:hypothetical protein